RDRLWNALKEGLINSIGSDHSPCLPEMKYLKEGDFVRAWGGIASLQLTLSTVWTGALKREIGLEKLPTWLSTNPSQLVGLASRKGQIAPGCDADLVIWNPEETWIVRGEDLLHRHPLTPYEGKSLLGKVKRTYVRGQLVFADGRFSNATTGILLQREQS